MLKYIAGNIIEDIATFTADDNVTDIDPTTVTVVYEWQYAGVTYGPNTITYAGATTPAVNTIAKLGVGRYNVQLDTSLFPGYWVYQWHGTGVGQALLPSSAIVLPAPL